VFHGNARIQDFPGNYTQYREWKQQEEKKEAAEVKSSRTEMEPRRIRTEEKAKLTFKEKREFEGLEQEIEQLEAEKEQISGLLSSGTLTSEELTERSTRLSQVMELIDEKTMRWLELSEKTI
jgi:ATP-binding cassette subfamily F protein uup